MLRKVLSFYLFFLFLYLSAFHCPSYADENKFFSYERFLLNQDFIASIPGKNQLEREVKKFARIYTDAFYALSADNLNKAEKYLLSARSVWPEYYGTDFLLGILYEEEGRYGISARYYKSYLNKLKALHDGQYRISEPIIKGLNMFGVENYEPAEELVKKRLSLYGIKLEDVNPVVAVPGFLKSFVFFLAAAVILLVTRKKIIPYIKLQERIKNPPEGFWVCRYCGTDNPVLRTECEKCRRKPEAEEKI